MGYRWSQGWRPPIGRVDIDLRPKKHSGYSGVRGFVSAHRRGVCPDRYRERNFWEHRWPGVAAGGGDLTCVLADGYSDTHDYAHSHLQPHTEAVRYADADAHAHAHTHTYRHPDADSNSHSDAEPRCRNSADRQRPIRNCGAGTMGGYSGYGSQQRKRRGCHTGQAVVPVAGQGTGVSHFTRAGRTESHREFHLEDAELRRRRSYPQS